MSEPPHEGLPHQVVPYLCADGAGAALDFYTAAFGAVEVMRMPDDDGRLMHSEFTIGEARFFLADEAPDLKVFAPTRLGGWSVSLSMDVADVDALLPRLVEHGARIERGPDDGPQPGYRHAWVVDPYGHRWHLESATAG